MSDKAELLLKPKRFYKAAAAAEAEGGFAVQLDGRTPKSPARKPLIVPTKALAELVAAEWEAQVEFIDNNRLIGTEAIRGKFGFRKDGSVMVAAPYRAVAAETLSRGAQYVTSSFPGAPHLSERQFSYIERLSRLSRDRRFSVVAIQYPILESAAAFLDTDETYWPYSGIWRELKSKQTTERLKNLGIQFYDMSRTRISEDPGNFFDPAHPSERGMLKTYLVLLDKPDFARLLPQMDPRSLTMDLDRSPGEQFDLYH